MNFYCFMGTLSGMLICNSLIPYIQSMRTDQAIMFLAGISCVGYLLGVIAYGVNKK